MPAPPQSSATPLPEEVIEGLAARGKAFVVATWGEYSGWSPVSSALLREAGMLIDALEQCRGQKSELARQRALVSVLAAMNLRER